MSYERLHREVIHKGLCTRCGLCVGICPADVIGLNDELFPKLTGKCTDCGFCIKACPGADIDFPSLSQQVFKKPFEPFNLWGYQANMYVGHPTDESIRRGGASGGLVTGILVYLLRTGRIKGAAVVDMDPIKPWRAKSILAKTEEELLSSSNSKYCIVPSMDVLFQMRKEKGPFAVVGLPCQIHGLRKLEKVDPKLSGKIAYIIGLYCHYNQDPDVVLDVLRISGVNPPDIAKFEFRGGGWPGGFFAITREGKEKPLHAIHIRTAMTAMLRLYGAERCYLCTDPTAEFADLAFGDFWSVDYDDSFGDLSCCTLCSQRTDKGREVLDAAQRDGAIKLHYLPEEKYSRSTIGFSKEKKFEGYVRLRRFMRQGKAVPNYHYPIPKINAMDWFAELIRYRLSHLFRAPQTRQRILKVLFSPAGQFMAKVNTIRKDLYHRQGGIRGHDTYV